MKVYGTFGRVECGSLSNTFPKCNDKIGEKGKKKTTILGL